MNQKTSWDPESYAKNAGFVSALADPVLDLLQAAAGEKILDLGCGDGALTGKIAALGCAVVGIDTSLAQLHAAGRRELPVILMDGRSLCLRARFDAVFSNAALHWIKEPRKWSAASRMS
jgi:trans-aconitate methyltransferase